MYTLSRKRTLEINDQREPYDKAYKRYQNKITPEKAGLVQLSIVYASYRLYKIVFH